MPVSESSYSDMSHVADVHEGNPTRGRERQLSPEEGGENAIPSRCGRTTVVRRASGRTEKKRWVQDDDIEFVTRGIHRSLLCKELAAVVGPFFRDRERGRGCLVERL